MGQLERVAEGNIDGEEYARIGFTAGTLLIVCSRVECVTEAVKMAERRRFAKREEITTMAGAYHRILWRGKSWCARCIANPHTAGLRSLTP